LVEDASPVKSAPLKIIYTILADDKPVAALEATGVEARELLKERWFAEELAALKVDGEPLYKNGTKLRARPATEEEWTVYEKESQAADDVDDILFVYLVDLDRE
jgi:hypothetical protein